MDYEKSGLFKDPRTEEEKKKDFLQRELYGATKPEWVVKKPKSWTIYSLQDQNGGSYCVGEAGAKAFEEELGEPMSALPFYTNRANKPLKGMWLQDLGRIAVKIGTVPERLLPSFKLTEEQANVPVDMSKFQSHEIKKAESYLFINPKDIDAMAQVLDDGHAIILTFESNYDEWKEVPVYNGKPYQWGHCVCNPKDRTLWTDENYKNEKALVVDESWGVGIKDKLPIDGKRVITEAFIKERCTGAMYFLFPKPTPPIPKPKYTFTKTLRYGMKNDTDVKALQGILAYEGFFPKESKYHTGNYLEMTQNAVKKLQEKYFNEILKPAGLTEGTGLFAQYSIAWANKKYK